MGTPSVNRDIPGDPPEDYHYPCRQIWAAVLQRAIDDLEDQDERIRDSARAWFHADRRGIGSLHWICKALDLDPGRVRSQVERMKGPKISLVDADRTEAARKFKQWRLDHGFTQKDMAAMLGYANNSAIAELERGRYDLRRALAKMTELGLEHNITIH
jgi:DNA-binding XRE family transcriptional regulator